MKKTLLILFLICAVLYTCKKETFFYNANILQTATSNSKLNLSLLNSYIKVTNGMLEFNNFQQYDSFIENLVEIERNWEDKFIDADTTYVLPDEALDSIEALLGFTSLRKTMELKKELILKNGQLYRDTLFIRDNYTRTTLNPEGEVKIGHSIFKLMNNKHIVEIADGDFNKLINIKQYGYIPLVEKKVFIHDIRTGIIIGQPKDPYPHERQRDVFCGNGICEIKNGENENNCNDCVYTCGNGVCETLQGENENNCYQDCGPVCGDSNCETYLGENANNCPADCGNGSAKDCKITVSKITKNTENCDALTWEFDVITTNLKYGSLIEYTWDFGDGVSTSTLNLNITHTYANKGAFTVKVTALDISVNQCGSDDKTIEVNAGVSPLSCDQTPHWTEGWYEYVAGRRFYYEVFQYNSIYGHWIGARTENQKLNNSGKWKETKADKIWASQSSYYYINDCVDKETSTCSEVNSNKKKAVCKDHTGVKLGTKKNEVTSSHYVKYNGIQYEKNLLLDVNPPCP